MGINIEQTRQYYTEIKTEDLCDCDYCKNFYLQVKEAYPLVADYLNALGVDIEKPLETSPLEPVNGMLEYCVCQYVVFGKTSGELVKKNRECRIRGCNLISQNKYTERTFCDRHLSN